MPALTLDPRRPPVAQQSRLSYQDAALGAFFVPETSNDFTDHGREVSKLRSLQQRQPKDTRTQPDPLEQSPTKTQGDHHHTHRSGRVADPEESAPRAQQKPNQQTICVSYCDTNRTETSLLSVDQLSQDLIILKGNPRSSLPPGWLSNQSVPFSCRDPTARILAHPDAPRSLERHAGVAARKSHRGH